MLGKLLHILVLIIAFVLLGNSACAQTFLTPGSWSYIVPSGVNSIQVLVAGGGGGGGGAGSFTSTNPGGSGGSGARITAVIQVTPGQVLSGTIGGGGETGYTSGSFSFGFIPCTGSGSGGPGVGAGGKGANTNCLGIGASGGGGGGGGGTTLALNGMVLLQAGGGGGGAAWSGGTASRGTTDTTLSVAPDCGLSAGGGQSSDFAFDGGGGGGGGGGYTSGPAGVSGFDFQLASSGGGGGNCRNGSSAITSITIASSGGLGANGVVSATTSQGPAGGSGYVVISTTALTITKSSTSVYDSVSTANFKSIPGSITEHCVLVTNNWLTNISAVTIVAQVASSESYVAASAKFGTTCAGASAFDSSATYSAGILTATAGTIMSNESYALVYRANIH